MFKKIYVYDNYDPLTKTISGTLKEPILFDDNSPGSDYTEQKTIKDIYQILKIAKKDNLFIQDKIRESFLLSNWSSITDEEKQILIDVSTGDVDVEKIEFLMSQGKTNNEAIQDLRNSWVFNYEKNKIACKNRLYSRRMNNIVAKYLKIEDSEDLVHTVRDLIDDYLLGIRGVAHQGDTYGLVDYYNSTPGTPYSSGLKENKSYIMQNGDPDMTNFIAETLDVLIYGNY